MSKKSNDKESMICLTPKPSQSFKTKRAFKEKGEWKIDQKTKRMLFNCSHYVKKDSTTSIRKHTNELKVHKKTVRTAIKQDSSPDLNPLDYAVWNVLENKTNATSHPNILVCLRLLLRKNEIKCLKNLF